MSNLTTITDKIYEIRGIKVMIDKDLAEMYGVETKVLKQAVKRNLNRFPCDFMFELSKEEFKSLRSQFVTSNKRGGSRYLPFAFTEHGIAMLSSVLNSEIAIEINIAIIRTFITIRQIGLHNQNLIHTDILSKELKELKEYIEDVFTDYNDINEDTRMQLDLINESLANLQVNNKPRNEVGYLAIQKRDRIVG